MVEILNGEKSSLKNVVIASWVILTVFLGFVLGFSAPWEDLMGESLFASIATIHGMIATLGVIIGSATGYLGWRLLLGHLKAYRDLRISNNLSCSSCSCSSFREHDLHSI